MDTLTHHTAPRGMGHTPHLRRGELAYCFEMIFGGMCKMTFPFGLTITHDPFDRSVSPEDRALFDKVFSAAISLRDELSRGDTKIEVMWTINGVDLDTFMLDPWAVYTELNAEMAS